MTELRPPSNYAATAKVVARGITLGARFQAGYTLTFDGKMVEVDQSPLNAGLNICWSHKLIMVEDHVFEDHSDTDLAGILIHELGHLCACKKPPDDSYEYNFLGWEWTLAKELGLEESWLLSVENYGIDGNPYRKDFAHYSPRERASFLQKRLAMAERLGTVRNGRVHSFLLV